MTEIKIEAHLLSKYGQYKSTLSAVWRIIPAVWAHHLVNQIEQIVWREEHQELKDKRF